MVGFLESGGQEGGDAARTLVHDLSNELSVLVHYGQFVADGLAELEAGAPIGGAELDQLRSQVDVLRGAITRTADLTHRLRGAVADAPDQAAQAVAGGAEPREPSSATASVPSPTPVPFELLPGPDRPAHVLVVEDDDAVRALAVRILTRADYRVTSAASGREAFELIAGLDGEVDLVLSDLRMDDVSGPELDERIRGVWPTLRTLFMSGYPEDHGGDGPLASGAAAASRPLRVIAKPFTVDGLLHEVEEALRGA